MVGGFAKGRVLDHEDQPASGGRACVHDRKDVSRQDTFETPKSTKAGWFRVGVVAEEGVKNPHGYYRRYDP